MSQRKIILKNFQCPGDILMLTAAVRDLKEQHKDKFLIGVDTSCGELWNNNPYLTKLNPVDKDVEIIEAEYPLINQSNESPYHFVHGFAAYLEKKLRVRIPVRKFKGDIHLSDDEKSWYSQIEEIGIKDKFWIINAGGKFDYTSKIWNPDSYQEVVNYFKGKITFVQCGESHHFHPELKGVINLIGKTDLRQFIRLVYHSAGVLCPVTFAMHAAAAVPVKDGMPLNRACVVVASGMEPFQWEAYPNHRYLALNGCLPCCDNGGCWKARCTKVKDLDEKNNDLCIYPIKVTPKSVDISKFSSQIDGDFQIPKCLDMIKPHDVIRAIERYYEGGCLKYGSCIPDKIPDKAKDFIRV
jgi:hypothetical protein